MSVLSRRLLALGGAIVIAAWMTLPAAAAGREVVVKAVGADGRPAAGLTVVVACDREFQARTDAQGELRFETSATEVSVTFQGSDGSNVTVKSGDATIRLTLSGRS